MRMRSKLRQRTRSATKSRRGAPRAMSPLPLMSSLPQSEELEPDPLPEPKSVSEPDPLPEPEKEKESESKPEPESMPHPSLTLAELRDLVKSSAVEVMTDQVRLQLPPFAHVSSPSLWTLPVMTWMQILESREFQQLWRKTDELTWDDSVFFFKTFLSREFQTNGVGVGLVGSELYLILLYPHNGSASVAHVTRDGRVLTGLRTGLHNAVIF